MRVSPRSDAALLARVRRGDRRALRLLYGRYAAEVFDFAVRFAGSAEGAGAIVEATFATAYDRLGVGIRPQRVEPWLLGIARGFALDVREVPRVSLPWCGGREGDRLELTRRWAETLTPRDYALVDLYVRRGLSVRELARVIGSAEQALRSRLERLAIDLEAFVSSGLVVGRVGRCLELPTLLAVVRGAEAAEMRRAVRLHARQCDVCRASLREASSPLGALAELPAMALPADLSASIWTRLATQVAQGMRPEPRRASAAASTRPAPGRARRVWIAAAGAGACAAGALAFVLADPFGETRPRTEAVTPKLGSATSVFTPPEVARPKKNEPATEAPATPPTPPSRTPATPPPPSSPPAAAKPPAATRPAPPPSQPRNTKPNPSAAPKPSTPTQEKPTSPQAQKPAVTPKPPPAPDPATAPASPKRAKSVGLAWADVPNAVGYEVVLRRGGRQVYKKRTTDTRTTIPTSWKVDGRTVQLAPGYYQWRVWPIFDDGKGATAVVVAAVHLD